MVRIAILAVALTAISLDQGGQKPKTPAKPPQTSPTRGTAQIPGDNGKLGVTYQLGHSGGELHFTLDSAEFAMRNAGKEETVFARAGQRLLRLHFTVHNPLKVEQFFDYNAFRFTSVSPDNENMDSDSWTYHPEKHSHYSVQLKPAQKIKAYVAFPVHGTGPITKLMVQRGGAVPILRYDLRDKVKPFKNVFAPAGTDAADRGTATLGVPFESGPFEVTVESAESVEQTVGSYELGEGQAHILVYVAFRNPNFVPHRIVWNSFEPVLTDANGEQIEWRGDGLSIAGNKTIDQDLAPGATLRMKYVFVAPREVKPKNLVLTDGLTQRTIAVTLP